MKKTILTLLMLAFAASALASAVSLGAGKSGKNTPLKKAIEKSDSLKITTNDVMDYDMDTGEATVRGAVEITFGDLKATGSNLSYNDKKQYATMSGNPLIKVEYADEATLNMKSLKFDIAASLLNAKGDCRIQGSGKSADFDISSQEMIFDMESNWVKSPTAVTAHYRKISDKKSSADNADGSGKDFIKADEFDIAASAIYYSLENGDIDASGPVRIDFEGGHFDAGRATGNIEKKTLSFTGAIKGSASGMTVTADKVLLDYAAQEATATGNVTIENEDGLRSKTDYVWFCYKKGGRKMRIGKDKGVSAEMLRTKDKKDKKLSF